MTKHYIFYIVLLFAILTGCERGSNKNNSQRIDAENMVYAAYLAKDYPRIIELADSFKKQKSFSEGKAYYWLGYAYDRLMQKRMAELYWKTGIEAVENSTDEERIYQPAYLHWMLPEPLRTG